MQQRAYNAYHITDTHVADGLDTRCTCPRVHEAQVPGHRPRTRTIQQLHRLQSLQSLPPPLQNCVVVSSQSASEADSEAFQQTL